MLVLSWYTFLSLPRGAGRWSRLPLNTAPYITAPSGKLRVCECGAVSAEDIDGHSGNPEPPTLSIMLKITRLLPSCRRTARATAGGDPSGQEERADSRTAPNTRRARVTQAQNRTSSTPSRPTSVGGGLQVKANSNEKKNSVVLLACMACTITQGEVDMPGVVGCAASGGPPASWLIVEARRV